MTIDLVYLNSIAINAARAAGQIIRQHMHDDIRVEKKEGGSSLASQVVTVVDKACEKVIMEHLLPTCQEFGLALLSEETEDDGSRLVRDYFWCIDPMDGTLAFINKYPGFSVSIALVAQDGTPQIGVVHDPSTDITYHAIRDQGAYKNNKSWVATNTNDYLTYVTDHRLKDTPHAGQIEDLLAATADKMKLIRGVKEISGGGTVLNAIHVVEQGPSCMLKLPKDEKGGGSLWDYAATACIYHELGLSATNYNGGRLDLNKNADTFMNHEGMFYSNY